MRCARCLGPLSSGTRQSVQRTAAFALAALVLYAPANLLPIMEMEKLGLRTENTIWSGCDENLAVRVGHYKLITSRKPGAANAVYDLERDPDEKENILAKSEAVTDLLRRYASEYWARGSAGAGGAEDKLEGLDEKSRQRLRALGYVQ